MLTQRIDKAGANSSEVLKSDIQKNFSRATHPNKRTYPTKLGKTETMKIWKSS